jgi:hypothetical protein
MKRSLLGGGNNEMSLVRVVDEEVTDDGARHRERRVMFVNWMAGKAGSIGQEVKDDRDGHVIFPMALHYPYRDLSQGEVLCPSVGVRVKKASQDGGRARFPEFAIRMRNMFVALEGTDNFSICDGCGQASVMKRASASSSSSSTAPATEAVVAPVVICPICLMAFHRSCSVRFLQRCQQDSLLPDDADASLLAPPEFTASMHLCELCSHCSV